MKIKDYNDAIEFFRTNDYQAADGAWSEFYQSKVLEPRIMDLADGGQVGTPTKEVTQHGRRIYETPEGERVSEKSKTLFFNGKWVNVPSIHDGVQYDSEDRLRNMLKHGKIQATSEHQSRMEAEEAAASRSNMMKSHTRGFEDGGRIGFEDAGPVRSKFYAPKAAETKRLKATKKLKDFVEQFKLDNDGKLPTQQQIMKAVGGKSETIQKYLTEGVDYATRATKQEAGKIASKQFGDLTEEAQIAIKEHFHDVDIDFSKNADGTYVKGKYGIAAGGRGDNKALYEQIRRFVANPEEWKYAYNLGAADGWLLSQMDRAGYEPIYETIKGNKKIIGHIDPDGNKYYGAKKWADKYDGLQVATSHPDYKETKRLVDITKKTRTLPNQAIQDILTKGGVPIDSRLQLNHLLNYLIDEKGVDVTKSALEKHHVRGVKHTPTKDLQLVTRIANAKANKIRNEIDSGVFDKIDVDDRLKKLGITLTDNKTGLRYGGKGFESIKEVEDFVETGLKKFDETKFKGLREALVRSGIPCKKGAGGQCTSIADYKKGYNQVVKEAADGSKDAIQKLKGFTKAMRGITGVAKWTGYGLLAEVGFMVPFAIGDYAAGESWKRILGNATDYGFGPILGQSEQEEFEAALPENSLAVQQEKALELGDQYVNLYNQTIRPGGRIGMDKARREKSRENVLQGIKDKITLNLDPFLMDTPWVQGGTEDAVEQLLSGQVPDQWSKELWLQAQEEAAEARERIAKEKQARIDERTERGIIADQNWQSQVSYAQGGIASLKRK